MEEERQENESLEGGNEETPQRQPWEKLPEETPSAYTAFCIYRDLGRSRSLDQVALQISEKAKTRNRPKTGHITLWSRDNRWKERALAWDTYQDETYRQAKEEELRQDVIVAEQRKRLIRERAWKDFERLTQQIEEAKELGPDGKPLSRLSPKAIRELSLAREKTIALAREAFYGLEQAPMVGADMPAEMAMEWEKWQVELSLRRKSNAGDPPLPS